MRANASQALNSKKFRRVLIVGLALTAVLLALASFALRVPAVAALVRDLPIGPGLAPTPLPPVIAAPAGPLPGGLAGVVELAQSGALDYQRVGSGFLLRLPAGTVIGVTTAHSVAGLGAPGAPGSGLQRLAFALPGAARHLAEFTELYGPPGVPFSGADLSVDYVLLRAPATADASLAQAPDPRGAPQPGERVALFSGLGADGGARRVLLGTVISTDPGNAWLLMDDSFDPGGMSGSPVLSGATGLVVGMAVAATRQRGRTLIGLNPIGAIMRLAIAATTFAAIASYAR